MNHTYGQLPTVVSHDNRVSEAAKFKVVLPYNNFTLESGSVIDFNDKGDIFINGEQVFGLVLINAIGTIMNQYTMSQIEEDEEYYNRPPHPKREKIEKPCDIYFIHDSLSGLTKIGRARCAKSRFKGMQTANPRIELLFYYRATESIEKAWHEKLNDLREYREWFRLTSETIEVIRKFVDSKNQAV